MKNKGKKSLHEQYMLKNNGETKIHIHVFMLLHKCNNSLHKTLNTKTLLIILKMRYFRLHQSICFVFARKALIFRTEML